MLFAYISPSANSWFGGWNVRTKKGRMGSIPNLPLHYEIPEQQLLDGFEFDPSVHRPVLFRVIRGNRFGQTITLGL
jgi:hypothetical protein